MARYQRITNAIWGDDRFTGLSGDGRLLYFYILTCPHGNSAGLFVLKMGYILEDLKWLPKRLAKPFKELVDGGLIRWDSETSVLWIPRHLKYNPISNINQAIHAAISIETLPANPYSAELLKQLEKRLHKPLMERLAERIPKSHNPLPLPLPLPTKEEPPLPPQPRQRSQRAIFVKPTAAEVQAYLDELGERRFTGQQFVDANDTRGWVVGKPDRRGISTPMADWKGAVRTWRTFRDRDGEVNPEQRANGAPPGAPQILSPEERLEKEREEQEKRDGWDRDCRLYNTPDKIGKYPWVKEASHGTA